MKAGIAIGVILTVLLIAAGIGLGVYVAGGHCKKKTPATLEENEKIVNAKHEEPITSYVVNSAQVPTVTISKPEEVPTQLQARVPAQFFEEEAAAQQAQAVAEKMSGSSLNSARRVQSTMHSSHHPRTNQLPMNSSIVSLREVAVNEDQYEEIPAPVSQRSEHTPAKSDLSNVSRRMMLSSYMINTVQVPNQVDDEDPCPETF